MQVQLLGRVELRCTVLLCTAPHRTVLHYTTQVSVLKGALGLSRELPDGALDSHAKLLRELAKVCVGL